ncbi:MAG: hypothetical protein U0359_31405 [Byssovorax sp.]
MRRLRAPADTKAAAGTVCRASAGACDVAETCDGAGNNCPADGFAAAATVMPAGPLRRGRELHRRRSELPADVLTGRRVVCRAAAGVCDAAETTG